MGLHVPFEYLNTSFGRKKGRESKCQFDSQPLKVRIRPNLLMYMWHATYLWKALDEGYKCFLNLTSIRGLKKKLWPSKVVRIPILGISGLSTWGVRGQNDIWVQAPWPNIENVIKGKVVASPEFGLRWICVCPWLVHAPKVLQPHTNQLVVLFV
jgi:hypothetical protein